MFQKIAIIGLGLIGSSIGHAARRAGLAENIMGYDADPGVRARAATLDFTTAIAGNMADAVQGADLVILCTPVGALKDAAAEAAPHLKQGAILSDVGSVKSTAIRDIAPSVPHGVHFVPAHPIAGTEFSGPEAGFASLFDGRWCILTPLPGGDSAMTAKLRAFWNKLGAQVDEMDATHHDMVLAITSHLPHLIAYNIVGTASDLESVREAEVIKYSASGFRDFTRIASSDPTMWRDIFLNNREAVLEVLSLFNRDLKRLEDQVRGGDGQALFDFFTRTRAIRKAIVEMGQDSAAANFGRK